LDEFAILKCGGENCAASDIFSKIAIFLLQIFKM
jgi:hypothetical protein